MYYVLIEGKIIGPLPETEVRLQAGPETPVSYGDRWVKLAEHPELAPGPGRDYYLNSSGRAVGPLTAEEILAHAGHGQMVSHNGSWLTREKHPLFNATPDNQSVQPSCSTESADQSIKPTKLIAKPRRAKLELPGGRSHEIGPKGLTIGRAGCEVVLDKDPTVSRRHAQIAWRNRQLILEDLGSSNGTQVDGQEITTPTVIVDGARITVGSTELILREAATKRTKVIQKDHQHEVSLVSESAPSAIVRLVVSSSQPHESRSSPDQALAADRLRLHPTSCYEKLCKIFETSIGSVFSLDEQGKRPQEFQIRRAIENAYESAMDEILKPMIGEAINDYQEERAVGLKGLDDEIRDFCAAFSEWREQKGQRGAVWLLAVGTLAAGLAKDWNYGIKNAVDLVPVLAQQHSSRKTVERQLDSAKAALASAYERAKFETWDAMAGILMSCTGVTWPASSRMEDLTRKASTELEEIAELQQLQEHQSALRRAIRFQKRWPYHPAGMDRLARCLIATGSPEEAIQTAKSLYRLLPSSPQTGLIMAEALVRQGDEQKAAKCLEVAFDCAPTDADLAYKCLLLAAQLGLYGQAKTMYTRLKRLETDGLKILKGGILLAVSGGDSDHVRTGITELIHSFPGSCGTTIAEMRSLPLFDQVASEDCFCRFDLRQFKVRRILEEMRFHDEDGFFDPCIPEKLIKNACLSYADLDSGEFPIFLHDASFFDNGKAGLLFGSRRLYVKSSGTHRAFDYKNLPMPILHKKKIMLDGLTLEINNQGLTSEFEGSRPLFTNRLYICLKRIAAEYAGTSTKGELQTT